MKRSAESFKRVCFRLYFCLSEALWVNGFETNYLLEYLTKIWVQRKTDIFSEALLVSFLPIPSLRPIYVHT
jgi:hypothetical protein